MERLRIRHLTRYLYTRPVELRRHRLVIRPREGHDLRIEQIELRIEPAHDITWVRDVFGNSIALVNFTAPAEQLDIDSHVIVRRFVPFPSRSLHDPVRVPYPVAYEPLEASVVAAYLAPSFPDDATAVADWLRNVLVVDPTDTEGTMLALCRTIHDHIRYMRREERGVQTPAQTLQNRSGSCRDMATLMMDAARSLGVAARFASGYLHGSASLAGRASTHAWTELYLPALGWRGLDATIGDVLSLRHVVTGVSNHPRGVMPISGTFAGDRTDFRDMIVQVTTEELPVS